MSLAARLCRAQPGRPVLIVAVLVGWLATLWWLAPNAPVNPVFVAGYVLLQGLRAWTLASLGRRWTTRIVVVPGERPVRRGP